MSALTVYLLCALQLFGVAVHCQFGPDPKWKNPDGSKADLSTTFQAGNTVQLAWDAINQSRADLWFTSWDNTKSTFNVSLEKDVDLSVAGTYTWKVEVGADVVKASNQFCLRFFPAGAAYGILQFHQFISPGFIIEGSTEDSAVPSPSSASTSSASASTTSSSSATTSSGTTTSTSASSAANSNGDHSTTAAASGLGGGAIAGIVIGAIVGIIAILALGCFLGRRFHIARRSPDMTRTGSHMRMHSGSSFAPAPPYSFIPKGFNNRTTHPMQELPERGLQRPAEIDAQPVHSKPGLYEL